LPALAPEPGPRQLTDRAIIQGCVTWQAETSRDDADRALLRPLLRGIVEQAMFAGPICGVLSALYTAQLAQSSPLAPNPALHATVLQVQSWHTHFLRNYYITPEQNTLSWVLAAPAIAWLVLLVPVLIGLGIRSHYAKDRR
jgi:hypothetical protein